MTVLENHAIYEILWKNIVHRGRLQMTLWRMRIACWIPMATNTHSEHVIPYPFLQQQQLHVRAPLLGLSVHCLSC